MLRFVKYLFRPYTLIVKYYSCIVVASVENGVMCGTDVRPSEPTLGALRFWSEKGLRRFAEINRVQKLKKEMSKTFSGAFYQD